ncbi:hypothetical protein MNAB215_5402 [Mycobacterium numidiamassiliense]|jgi:hypothetical protein|uniref:SAM-dependent methyltransferase n=1 Tax=Mycobacterium numidiamassiliense TaxID=1841861 RepID=A0A2U3PHG1_9MYCO|nr:hypothetical protein [Mycobacterium numidiamassiliense]SPM43180.1 hypothetical protein MNAB215_5402 [Mycobacterium numidiamassiliense]
MAIDNPYWDTVKDSVETDTRLGGGPVVGFYDLKRTVQENLARSPNRQALVRKYSWSIPDPETVEFVAQHAHNGLVDPIAGTGYWAYVLGQLGVDVVCYDLKPGAMLHVNGWHGEDLYADVCARDCAEAVALHSDRTLFLSWPPHGQDVGQRTLLAYQGQRVIYIGEGPGGANGNDAMHMIIDRDWTEIDSRQPVKWWPQRDRVTVYQRREPAA